MEKTQEELLMDKIKSEVKNILDGKIGTTEDRLKEMSKELADVKAAGVKAPEGYDTVKSELASLVAAVNAMKENPAQKASKGKSVKDQLKAFAEANQEKWAAMKKGELKNLEIPIDIKSATTMLESNALGGSSYLPYREIVPGVTDIARTAPLIEQYANTSTTGSANIVWVNKTNPEGTVVFLAEGEVKTLLDFNFATETSVARKAPGKIKVSTEMLEDFDFMAAEIENELRYQVDNAVDEGLLTGDGIAPNLAGITSYAGSYILTTLDAVDASNSDAIIAAATQIETLNFKASHAFVNPIDYANMRLTKDSTGQYVTVLGMPLGVEVVSSNKVTQGYVLVADMSKYIVRNYKPFTISIGHTGDDFERNLVTIIGERRLHAYASDNNTGAFVYDTFANIKAALTPAP